MAILTSIITLSCTSKPEGVEPVKGFKLDNYLGKWYEIARLDHSFERGLSNVTAEYSMREDGGVKVLNQGYSDKNEKWKKATGKAYFLGDKDEAHLKVSFFGPFYGSYIVTQLDHENYQYSLVCGPSKKYLWILARKPQLDDKIKDKLVKFAKDKGFDTDALLFIKHDKADEEKN